MPMKTGQFVSVLLILVLILFWSASILGAETEKENPDAPRATRRATTELAVDAAEAAADEAAEAIAKQARRDLDNRLNAHNSQQLAAN